VTGVAVALAPDSRAVRIAVTAASSSKGAPQSPPNCHVPNAMRDTWSPLHPSIVVLISLQSWFGIGDCGCSMPRSRSLCQPAWAARASVSLPLIPIVTPCQQQSASTGYRESAATRGRFAVSRNVDALPDREAEGMYVGFIRCAV
jgi:hypothetical protein